MDFEWYLDRFKRELRTHGRSQNTIDKYEEILRRMDAELPCGVLRACTDELEDWIWIDGRKPATLGLYRTVASAFFTFATDEVALAGDRLDLNPARYLPKVKKPRRTPRPAQQDQLRDILARAREPYRTWFIIAAGAGLRCVDLSLLDREDCTAEALHVVGKGGVERTVFTHPEVWRVIEPLPSGPICRTADGRRATARQVQVRGNTHLRRLGYRLTMHKLRSYFGTELHEAAGGDILITQEQMGHSEPSTTRIYVLTNRRKAASAVAAIPLPV